MRLKKLTESFYRDNTHLIEALDLKDGHWVRGKTRGYGIAIITIKGLTFGIPLRSNIKHSGAYITKRAKREFETNKGLDFSKALLLKQDSYSLPYRTTIKSWV